MPREMIVQCNATVKKLNVPSFLVETKCVKEGKIKTTTAPQSPPTYRMMLPIVGRKMAKHIAIIKTIELSKNIFL